MEAFKIKLGIFYDVLRKLSLLSDDIKMTEKSIWCHQQEISSNRVILCCSPVWVWKMYRFLLDAVFQLAKRLTRRLLLLFKKILSSFIYIKLVFEHTHAHTHTYTHTYLHTCIHTHRHAYIHTHIYIYIYLQYTDQYMNCKKNTI